MRPHRQPASNRRGLVGQHSGVDLDVERKLGAGSVEHLNGRSTFLGALLDRSLSDCIRLAGGNIGRLHEGHLELRTVFHSLGGCDANAIRISLLAACFLSRLLIDLEHIERSVIGKRDALGHVDREVVACVDGHLGLGALGDNRRIKLK